MNKIVLLFFILLATNANAANKIGFLAPLTGIYAPFSERLLKGASIAADFNNSEIIALDTKAKPLYSKLNLQWLSKHGVNRVIGPIFYSDAVSVGPILKNRKMLLISPSGAGDKDILSLSINPNIAYLLAKYAKTLNAKNIAVIYPYNKEFKEKVAELFFANFKHSSNISVKMEPFNSEARDLSGFVKRIFHVKRIGVGDFSCDIPDLLLLDTSLESGEKILSLFKYYGCFPGTILVLPFWHDGSILKVNQSLLKNVVIGSLFYNDENSFTRRFADTFKNRFGYYPELTEAIGFDLANYLINFKNIKELHKLSHITMLYPNADARGMFFLKIERGRKFVDIKTVQNK